MKIKHLRIPAFILALIVVLSVFMNYGFSGDKGEDYSFVAKAVTYVGNCGENCKWTLNLKLETLTIDGSGNTYSYEFKRTPWYKYRNEIKAIFVSKGVKTIGNFFFAGLNKVKTAEIASTVQKFGDSAFYGCESLRQLNMPASSKLKTIGDNAFAFCRKLQEIPSFSSLKSIGKSAFFYCYSLSDVTLGYSVKSIEEGAFSCCRSLKKLRIVNYDCEISDSESTVYAETAIEGFNDSTAKSYADKYSRDFIKIKDIKYLNDLKVKLQYDSIGYDGSEKTPSVSVKGLKKSRDYTLKYSYNIEPGQAKVTLYAAGNTLGKKTVTFKINPPKVKNVSLASRKTDSISFKWNKAHGADKYEVFQLQKGSWVKIATTKKTSFTAENLSSAEEFSFRVRAVSVFKEGNCKGKMSDIFTDMTRPQTTEILKLGIVRGGGKLRVTLKRVSGADGYEILLATKEHGKYKSAVIISNSKNLSVVLDNLNNSDTFYIKARSFVNSGKSKIYSTVCDALSSGVL